MAQMSDKETASSLFDEVKRLQGEIAALREPMACGHPRACWTNIGPSHSVSHPEIIFPETWICTACEDKRLAVATALGEAGKLTHGDSGMGVVMDAGYNAGWNDYGVAVRSLKGGSK